MVVELGYHYIVAFDSNNNEYGKREFLKFSKHVLERALAKGNHNGGWYKIQFVENDFGTSCILNIYYEGDVVFQASQNLYGDWTILLNEFHQHRDLMIEFSKFI